MYLSEANEVFDYWVRFPPTYQLVALIARMLGWEPARSDEADAEPPDFDLQISAEMADAIGQAAGVPAPVVDLEQMRERNRQRTVEIAERNMARG